jgi:hypothetical protein
MCRQTPREIIFNTDITWIYVNTVKVANIYLLYVRVNVCRLATLLTNRIRLQLFPFFTITFMSTYMIFIVTYSKISSRNVLCGTYLGDMYNESNFIQSEFSKETSIIFCSLDHAFSNYDERKPNEMHFQSKPYTYLEYQFCSYTRFLRLTTHRRWSTPYLHLFGTYDVANAQFHHDPLGSLKMALLQRRNM